MTVPKSMGGFPAYTGKSSDDGMKKYIGRYKHYTFYMILFWMTLIMLSI